MRILYVARHDSGGSDDEGAILHALRELGHDVVTMPEQGPRPRYDPWPKADLCLFHKWSNVEAIRQVRCPKVFWYFDLVDWPGDETLARRCKQRRAWMTQTIQHVGLGFCTDGDWVARWNDREQGNKLVWLPQGADERVVGRGTSQRARGYEYDILLTGISTGGGVERESFVRTMELRYGQRFHHVQKGVYRRDLADLIAASKVIVCPDSPVTDRYWSNRVYNALGFGAFILHPYCSQLVEQLGHGGCVYYTNRDDLFNLIDFYIGRLSVCREGVSTIGMRRVQAEHLYRHRCETLIRTCQERLGCPS